MKLFTEDDVPAAIVAFVVVLALIFGIALATKPPGS